MNLHQAIVKHFGEGRFEDQRIYVEFNDRVRKLRVVNDRGLSLKETASIPAMAIWKDTPIHITGIRKLRTIFGVGVVFEAEYR